jgi:hypothetical protein
MRAQLGAVRAHQTAQRTPCVASCTSRLNTAAVRLNRPADGLKLGSVGFVSGEFMAPFADFEGF